MSLNHVHTVLKQSLRLVAMTGLFTVCFLSGPSISFAHTKTEGMASTEKPRELVGVGITEQLGKKLNLDLSFTDENGQKVKLGDYFDGKMPVIISPVYFGCGGLCNFHLNGLVDGLKGLDWTIGQKFRVLAVSFDAKEGPELAIQKKKTYLDIYGRPGVEADWHYLSGKQEEINAFLSSVGFNIKWNDDLNEWAHPSAAIMISPEGVISRYLPGITFDPRDIKFALTEAGQGQIGTFVDSFVLYCFQFDSKHGKYSPFVANIMKMGGGITMAVLALILIPFWLRVRRNDITARSGIS